MFGPPGGIQLFTPFNLAAFLLLLVCFVAVVLRARAGLRGSVVIAALSGIVLPIHAAFGLASFTQFDVPVSIAIIVGTIAVSLWKASLTWRVRSEFAGGA